MPAEMGRGPGLRTGHLLLWVVGCAVGFATYRSIEPPRIELAPKGRAIVAGYTPAMGMAFGTILTGCGLLAYRRWQGDRSILSRAGHWLLLFGLAVGPADVAAVVAFHLGDPQDPQSFVTPYLIQFHGRNALRPSMYHQAVGWGTGAVIALGFLLAARRRLERRWCAVFLLFFLAAVVLAAGNLLALARTSLGANPLGSILSLMRVYTGCVVLSALAILRAAAGDRRSAAPADGLHRLGVGAWLGIAAIQLVMYCLFILLY